MDWETYKRYKKNILFFAQCLVVDEKMQKEKQAQIIKLLTYICIVFM